MHYFYIARCRDQTLYSGYTTDIKKREATHNAGKGAKYTRARLPVNIVYFEKFNSKSKAMKREAQVKGFTRENKLFLIKNGKRIRTSKTLDKKRKI